MSELQRLEEGKDSVIMDGPMETQRMTVEEIFGEDSAGNESADESDEDDVYVVEKIVDFKMEKARISSGVPKYLVKWEKYSSKDNTWESYDNVKDCVPALELFWRKTRLRRPSITFSHTPNKPPQHMGQPRKRGRPPIAATRPPKDPVTGKPPAVAEDTSRQGGLETWDHLVERVEDVQVAGEEEPSEMIFLVLWKDGRREQHEAAIMYQKCPLKIIEFFSQRIEPL
ncbi:hypothetical protein DFJ77DRAFT_514782 [Powellomyces hirtus]|nr:hypothetical protein DFJ77DRAFT_514782 [Powellomyces hirtus]